jgi:hypothetical protein
LAPNASSIAAREEFRVVATTRAPAWFAIFTAA